jgi:cell division protein FtsB
MKPNFHRPGTCPGPRAVNLPMSDQTPQPADTNSRRIPWWSFGIVVVVLTFALFGDRGILHLFKQKRQQADLQQQLAEVEEVNAGLRQEIASLSADRRHLERLARSQLGMVREDEVVYQFASKDRLAASPRPVAGTATSR